MSGSARVDSIDTLRDLRVSLCKFADVAKGGLSEAEAEIQRTVIWLRQDQLHRWKGEVRKRAELVTRAKLALKRRQIEKTPLGGRYSCVDEKKALALAQRRLEEAERKLANVQRWTRQLEQEAFNYKSLVQGLGQVVEEGIPVAIAQLDHMVVALDSYVALAPPTEESVLGDAAVDDASAGPREATSGRTSEASPSPPPGGEDR